MKKNPKYSWKTPIFIAVCVFSCIMGGFGIYDIYVRITSDPTHISPIFSDCVLPAISIIITGILSYLIWRANKTSANLSGRLASLEIQRDISSVRDNATALYFSLLSCIDSLFFNYARKDTTRTLYCNQKWIENLSALSFYLTEEETYWLFNFFKDSNQFNQSYETIAEICKSTFDESVLEYMIAYPPKERVMAKLALCLFPHHVLTKLDLLRTAETETKTLEAKILAVSEKRVEKYKNNVLFYEIEYKDGAIKHKKIFDGASNIIEDCRYEKNQATGFKTIYQYGEKVADGRYVDGVLFDGHKYNVLFDDDFSQDTEPEEEPDDYPSYCIRYYKTVKVELGQEIFDNSQNNIDVEYV